MLSMTLTIRSIIILINLLFSKLISSEEIYDITKYGAKADGITNNAQAIAKAIAQASLNGGGTVYFPGNGTYITGPIRLKTNITLDISPETVIKFTDVFDDYLPMVLIRENQYNFSPLIYSYNEHNIVIRGGGTIDGSGQKWWDWYNDMRATFRKSGVWPVDSKWQKLYFSLNNNTTPDDTFKIRPQLILIIGAENVTIKDVMLKNSPFYHLRPLYCDNVVITGVRVESPAINAPNTDGIDPDSCSNVYISNCIISVGDDCLSIKAGSYNQGLQHKRSAENIVVTNCTMKRGHGGIVIGSGTYGGVRNVTVNNCVFNGTDRGVRIKSSRGIGGVVQDIRISDIIMENIVDYGITLNMFYTNTTVEPFSDKTPVFRDIYLRNISGTANQGIELIGLEESPIDNVSLIDINIKSKTDQIVVTDVKNIQFKNVTTYH